MSEHNKLVRDKVPGIIEANGDIAVTRILGDAEFRAALIEKVAEEEAELEAAETLPQKRAETADLEEVANEAEEQGIEIPGLRQKLLELKQQFGAKEVEAIRLEKLNERGGFKARIFLERTE